MNPPKMPIHIGDYMRDTGHLRAAGHGAYLMLLFHHWSTGSLPDDDEQLAAIARMSPAEWRKARPTIEKFFAPGWHHGRVEKDLAEARASYEKRAKAGEKGGKAKAGTKQSYSNATAGPEQPLTFNQGTKEESSSLRSEARKRATRLPADWVLDDPGREFARLQGLTASETDVETEKFRNHWTAKGGKDAAKVDWPATWRNWILNAIAWKGKPNGTGHRGGRQGSAAGDFFAGIAEVAANIGGDDRVAGREVPDIPRGRVEIDG